VLFRGARSTRPKADCFTTLRCSLPDGCLAPPAADVLALNAFNLLLLIHMAKIPSWLVAIWQAIRQRFASLWRSFWGKVLTVSFAASVVWWIADREIGDEVYAAGRKFFTSSLPGWAQMPIGHFWMLLFGCLAVSVGLSLSVAILLAWWDNHREKSSSREATEAKSEPKAPPTLSPEEKNSIEVARVFWGKIGKDTTAHPAFILQELAFRLPGTTTRLAALLNYPLQQLWRVREAFEEAVDDQAAVSLSEVIGRLHGVFQAYMEAVRYMHACEDHGVKLSEKPYGDRYRAWEKRHPELISYLKDMAHRSDYKRLQFVIDHNGGTHFTPPGEGQE
jgi:hypothetical protein